jgi:hypothetical protein
MSDGKSTRDAGHRLTTAQESRMVTHQGWTDDSHKKQLVMDGKLQKEY